MTGGPSRTGIIQEALNGKWSTVSARSQELIEDGRWELGVRTEGNKENKGRL